MRRLRRPPRRRALAAAVLAAGAAVGLSACTSAQDGQALAQQACVHVHRSLTLWVRSTLAGTSPAASAQLQNQAEQELRAALPIAARANSDDGSWNSLMTTISESSTVDEAHLLPALRAQCVVADANQNENPQTPDTNVNPRNVNPTPASPG